MEPPAAVVAQGGETVADVRGGQAGRRAVGLPGLPQDRRERQRRPRAAADRDRRAPAAPGDRPDAASTRPRRCRRSADLAAGAVRRHGRVPGAAQGRVGQTSEPTAGRRAGSPDPQVRAMFDRIAGVYDLMNGVMTAGLHHRWRSRAADLARVGPGDRGRSTSRPAPATWRSSCAARGARRRRAWTSPRRCSSVARAQGADAALRAGRRAGAAPTRTARSTPRRSASARGTSATCGCGLARDGAGRAARRAGRRARDHDADQAAAVDVLLAVVRPARARARARSPATPTPTRTCRPR